MNVPIVFEQPHPVILCQCRPACLQPYKEEGRDDWLGCMLPEGHEPPHSMDGTGQLTYREEPVRVGPRVVLRSEVTGTPAIMARGTCPRCHREYAMEVRSFEHVHTYDREWPSARSPMPEWFPREMAIAMLADADDAAERGAAPPLPPHDEPTDELHDVLTCQRCTGLIERTGVVVAR